MCAPIEGIKPRQIGVKELVSRANRQPDDPIMESAFSVVDESFIAANVPADMLDYWAELRRMGRRPHAEAVAGLLQNFENDGNRYHLVQAIEILQHLKELP